MKYTLNGSAVTLNKDILSEESLNTMIKEIDSSYNSCSKAIETYNLVSNVKAIESFGYKATEGLGESIKNGAKAIWEKIKEFFKKISLFTNKLITDFIVKINFPFEKDKTKYATDTNRKRFLDASKFLYNASVKILKKISSPDIYNNTEAIKAYQKLEIYTGKLTKILRNGISIVAKADRYLKKLFKLYSENMNKYQSKIDQFQDAWKNNISNFFILTCRECEVLYQYCDLETYDDLFDRVSHQDKLDNLLEQSKNIVEKFTLKISDVDSSDNEQKTVDDDNINHSVTLNGSDRINWVREGTRAVSNVIKNILDNKFDKQKVAIELSKLEQKYGKDVFVPYSFKKKDQSDWNEKYLEELKMKIMAGASSKDFIIHLAEVNDYLRKKKFFLFR
jgi:hypothetical protein